MTFRRVSSHLPAAGLFVALALAWTFPLVLHLGTHVPGLRGEPGENLTFVWNIWWMRTALSARLDPFHTAFLFHPVGVDLAQHTHTALQALFGATFLGWLSPLAAQDVILLASVFLNCFVAYLLAYRLARNRFAAVVAGIAFGGAAPVLVRLYGHFNLVSAWVIPLSVLAFLRAFERRSVLASVSAGAAVAAAAYSDYYYLLYAMVLLAVCLICRWFDVSTAIAVRARRWPAALFLALAAVDVALMAAIAITGGFAGRLAGVSVSMRTTFNERVMLWALLAAWALARWRVTVRVRRRPDPALPAEIRTVAIAVAAFACAVLPLVAHTARLMVAHEYTSHAYMWRSAPAGVDAAAFVLGNPLNGVYGALTRRAYDALGMNVMEGTAWIGAVVSVLALLGWRRLRSARDAAPWRAAMVLFGVWSLGPYLNLFGVNLGLVLPQTLLRFVPVAANARMPDRAAVVTCLAAAMLAALLVARLAAQWSSRRKALIVGLLLFDLATGPLPLYRPQASSIYSTVRLDPTPGAVLEVPLGLRDALGQWGQFDSRTLFWQTLHGRPIVGGFVGRLPDSVKAWYARAPVISTLLRLSEAGARDTSEPAEPSGQEAFAALASVGVRYVVLDRALAPERLIRYVASLPLVRVARDGDRELYILRTP